MRSPSSLSVALGHSRLKGCARDRGRVEGGGRRAEGRETLGALNEGKLAGSVCYSSFTEKENKQIFGKAAGFLKHPGAWTVFRTVGLSQRPFLDTFQVLTHLWKALRVQMFSPRPNKKQLKVKR